MRLILIMTFVMFSCSLQVSAYEPVDGIAAIVGSDIVLRSDVAKARKEGSRPDGEILDELIDEKLLKQEIARLGIKAGDEEISQAIKSVLIQNRMTLDALKGELSTKGISFDDYREELGKRISVMKFIRQVIYPRVEVAEEDFDLYKKRHPAKAKGESSGEISQKIFDEKAEREMKSYLAVVRSRTYVEIKK